MSNEMTTNAGTINKTPAVGQRWLDMEKRGAEKGRRELVLLQETTTTRQSRGKPQLAFECAVYRNSVATGRKRLVRADRFKPHASGYSYVGEGAPSVVVEI